MMDKKPKLITYLEENKDIWYVFHILFSAFILNELLFRYFVFDELFSMYFLRIVVLGLPIWFLITLFVTTFSVKIQKIVIGLILSILSIYYIAQLMFYSLMNSFITFRLIGLATEVTNFISDIIDVLHPIYLLFLVPILLFGLMLKNVPLSKHSIATVYKILFVFFIGASVYGSYQLLNSDAFDVDGGVTDIELFADFEYQELAMYRFGVLSYLTLDITHSMHEDELSLDNLVVEPLPEEVPDPVDISDNGDNTEDDSDEVEDEVEVIEVDIDEFEESWLVDIENETNDLAKQLHEIYFSRKIKETNDHTGLFEGKNLILFLGEAFDQISVNESFTPTLYKMSQEGYYFKNHFAPMYSCATGESEFMALTSLVPVENVCTPNSYSENEYPFSLPALFNKKGYYTSSYHDYYDKYYDRDILHPSLGFSQYLNRTGLDMEKLVKGWPSDEVMMQKSIDYWSDEENFFTFYVTVSGHFPYYDDGTIILENWDTVKDWDADYLIQKYVATQVELDRSIKYLMDELEAKGELDNTVFAIFPDHYPFKIDPSLLNEYSTVSDRTKDMNANNVPMIIWTPNMEGQVIEKYTNTLDILPTLANLFDLNYDARYYFGQDVFSDSEGLVIFRSSSWITDLGFYNATKNEFTPYTDQEVDDSYIERYNKIVRQYFELSYATLESDYYQYREE